MAETKVIMPQMGESIFEGTLTKWLKKPGDTIKRDEPLFEISTDKIDSEIPAPASGTLQQILVQEGQTVEINTVVGIIGDGNVAAKTAPPPPPVKAAVPTPSPAPSSGAPVEEEDESTPGHVSPIVRRLAREHGIDLTDLAGKGTGVNGRITKNDILAFIDQRGGAPARPSAPVGPSAPSGPSGDVERVPMSAMRKSIAEHMTMSLRTSAHVTTFFEVDCSSLMAAREILKPEFERWGEKLTVTPFFVLAAVSALKRFPVLNASVEGDTVVYRKTINVGIAVNVEGGLLVPVIKDAGEKSLQQLSHAINDLGERARTKKLTPDDVQGGTFSVTNPGQFGAVIGTPIINQPQVAILCMGGIRKRAVVVDDAIVARPMIMLALSFDHRVIDGAVADQFMADIQKQLEDWK
jgi:pyruvate dehydrogenase E2 component (dihydrolipoyllysine-residue acetyltransferase)